MGEGVGAGLEEGRLAGMLDGKELGRLWAFSSGLKRARIKNIKNKGLINDIAL